MMPETEDDGLDGIDFRLWPVDSQVPFVWQGDWYLKCKLNLARSVTDSVDCEPVFIPSHDKVFFALPDEPKVECCTPAEDQAQITAYELHAAQVAAKKAAEKPTLPDPATVPKTFEPITEA